MSRIITCPEPDCGSRDVELTAAKFGLYKCRSCLTRFSESDLIFAQERPSLKKTKYDDDEEYD